MKIDSVDVKAYRVPTESPESDGTLEWSSTTLVAVHISAAGMEGFGYSYADAATATLIRSTLASVVEGRSPLDVEAIWWDMIRAVRNIGSRGVASMAIAAIDVALWDLKARLLEVPLVNLLGKVRESVPVYGSGGFTSLDVDELRKQLSGWVEDGIPRVKMKVGRNPSEDPKRVRAARDAIGDAELFVDANGAYTPKLALREAMAFAELGVTWFEEPVSSDDLEGLRFIREHVPPPMEVTAGEYGYDLHYFDRMIAAGSIDVLQADATRCRGITGFLKTATLCESRSIPLSAHTAPSLHAPLGCVVQPLRHIEYFFDHVRIESMLFDPAPTARLGAMSPDLSRNGIGFVLRKSDAAKFEIG